MEQLQQFLNEKEDNKFLDFGCLTGSEEYNIYLNIEYGLTLVEAKKICEQLNQLLLELKEGRIEMGICLCCNGTGIVEGEHYDDKQPCRTCNGQGKLKG